MRLGKYFHHIWKFLQKRPPDERSAYLKRDVETTGITDMVSSLRGNGLDFISGPVPDPEQEGWYVFSTVRNEILRLPYFLHFYRKMGTRLFIIADNQSQDGTTEYLKNQPDVVLFCARGSYAESRFGVDWLNVLLHRFGQNRWCLTVDADELLVFPHCEQLSLVELTRYLEARGANALPTFLLDMYSREPIREAKYQARKPFLSVCPFFDASGYQKQETAGPTRNVPSRGGPRSRLFWEGRRRDKPSPFLAKIPLVRWSEDLCYKASTHTLSTAQVCEVSGVLLHFKFFADFPSYVEEEVRRGEHFNGGSQYVAYQEVVLEQPNVSAFYEGSVRYSGSAQLIEMGLIYSSKAFDQLATSQLQSPPDSGDLIHRSRVSEDFRMNSKNYNKFIIIGRERTGTTYMQTLLNSHNQIVSYGEIFHLLSKRKNDLYRIVNNPREYINQEIYKLYANNIKAVGFKITYGELGADNIFLREMETKDVPATTKEKRENFSQFMRTNFDLIKIRQTFDEYSTYLKNNLDIKIIHMKRRNKLNIFLSYKLASRSGAWASTNGSYLPRPTHLDFKECLRFFEETATWETKYDSLFEDHETIHVVYEDMIKDANNLSKKMQCFLGVEYETLSSSLKKQNKMQTSETISNYFELKERFKYTEWIRHFEE